MDRLEDWQARLTAYLVRVAKEPFRPALFDCAMFAANVIEAVTGTNGRDLVADLGWQGYMTLDQGRAALEKAGCADLTALAASVLPSVDPIYARPGDLVVITGVDGMDAFAVHQGSFLYAVGRRGLDRVHLDQIKTVYRVG